MSSAPVSSQRVSRRADRRPTGAARRPGLVAPFLLVLAPLALLTACSSDAAEDPTVTTVGAVGDGDAEAFPAVDDSVFCRTLLGIDDAEEPPTLDELVATYVDLRDEAPEEIRATFDVVLAALVAAAAGDAVDDPDATEAAVEALAEFIETRCRGTDTSPLPPPTAPN